MSFIVEGNGRRVEVRYDAVEVILSDMDLQEIPRELLQCTRLRKLYIWINEISVLENMPEGLQELYIYYNNISKLENLPNSLQELDISHNKIFKLENLPDSLQELYIVGNEISKLENLLEGPSLPLGGKQLQTLDIRNNPLEELNKAEVPRYLKYIYTNIRSVLTEDINSGRWAARHKEEDRQRILLDFLCCCRWAPSASEGPSVAHLEAVRPKRRRRRHRKKHNSRS